MVKYVKTEQGYVDASIFAPAQFKPEGKSYLTFSSPKNFTLEVNNRTKNWDGILEYFASDKTWTVWDGTTILSGHNNDDEYVLYLRGTGNTKITGIGTNKNWIITGTDIKCIGNIENLLDYATVASGNHPTLTTYCYSQMFSGCTSLTQAPTLPATTLASHCYEGMFLNCYSLTKAPKLPATTLSDYCYSEMFSGCTRLTQAPALPATTLVSYCYFLMFFNCSSLTQAPDLPATTLASNCYDSMFHYCTSLTQAPALPATKLSDYCYQYMFQHCNSLTKAPKLPATTLASYCYDGMFRECIHLTQAPKLPATTLSVCCYRGMFYGCISLTKAPALPATTLSDYCYPTMFSGCISLIQTPALPATKLASHCYDSMFERCTALKLSSTKTVEYAQEYRIPTTGTGTTATDALTNMFVSTGGTFTGTPAINTTYYLSTDNMIVRDTEVATLNGYVGSMIDNSVSNPLNITGATVGQIAKITAVDESGKPTSWEAVDGGVQPDWNQNDETAPDYVKNRPFYTGDPVETVLVEESTVTFAAVDGGYMGHLDSTFSATVGETYKVYWDGAAYECTCVDVNNMPAIGNLSIMGAGSDTGDPFLMAVYNGRGIEIYTADTSASHTFSISRLATEVVKIDEKYLPDTVATKSEVEATQKVLDGVFSSVATFTFDKQTSGRDTFNFNGFNYYKISDFNPAPENVISFKGTTEDGDESSNIMIGSNCVGYGFFIVVAAAGHCSLPVTETVTYSFDAPSAGLYACYEEGNTAMTAGTGEFTLRASTGSLYITGLLLKSSTAESTKKFKITVDDSGVPTITDESDSTNTWKPTNLPTVTSSDSGKFLRVSDTGEWVAETILSATVSNNTLIIR